MDPRFISIRERARQRKQQHEQERIQAQLQALLGAFQGRQSTVATIRAITDELAAIDTSTPTTTDITTIETRRLQPLPITGDVPLGPIRDAMVSAHGPRETIYQSDDNPIVRLGLGVRKHMDTYTVTPDRIEMQQFMLEILALSGVSSYPSQDRHIPFTANNALSIDTIKLISDY